MASPTTQPLISKKHQVEIGILITLVLLLSLVSNFFEARLEDSIFSDPTTFKEFVSEFGILAPLIIMLLFVLQAFLFLIPGGLISIATGYLFGPVIGTIINLTGTLIGTTILFIVTRKLGKHVLHHWLDPVEIQHVHHYFHHKGKIVFFSARLIPLFPNEIVTVIGALSGARFRDFLFFSFLGFLPSTVLFNVFGSELSKGTMTPLIFILGACLVITSIIYLLRHKLKLLLIKEIRMLEGKKGYP